MRITAVTVTYGDRWHLLRRTLQAAFSQCVYDAVIADNASRVQVSSMAAQEFPGKIRTVRLENNLGSAGGFAAGIRAAIQQGAEYLLLLDDDNEIRPGFIEKISNAYNGMAAQCDRSCLCLLGARQRTSGAVESRNSDPRNCFLGFNVFGLPGKIRRHTLPSLARPSTMGKTCSLISRKTAPYGGLLFHQSVIERFGFPNEDMVLYQDDLEFTNRITSQGGQIWQDSEALIVDLEQSWFLQRKRRTSMEDWLEMGSDRQVFYTVRNRIYLELLIGKVSLARRVNKAVYLALLLLVALIRGRLSRYRLILQAIRDGEAGILGVNPDLPLAV